MIFPHNQPPDINAHKAFLDLVKRIDGFLGDELHRMFGKPLVDLYKESGKQIPGVEFSIFDLPAEPGMLLKRKVQLKFKNTIIKEAVFIIKMTNKNDQDLPNSNSQA